MLQAMLDSIKMGTAIADGLFDCLLNQTSRILLMQPKHLDKFFHASTLRPVLTQPMQQEMVAGWPVLPPLLAPAWHTRRCLDAVQATRGSEADQTHPAFAQSSVHGEPAPRGWKGSPHETDRLSGPARFWPARRAQSSDWFHRSPGTRAIEVNHSCHTTVKRPLGQRTQERLLALPGLPNAHGLSINHADIIAQTLLQPLLIQLFKGGHTRYGHEKISATKPNRSLNTSLLMPLCRGTEMRVEEGVTAKGDERTLFFPNASLHDARLTAAERLS